MIKCGVIGLGSMGKNHLRVLKEIDSVEVEFICDKNEKDLNKYCEKYKLTGYNDYNDVLENIDSENTENKIDFVTIATPTFSHEKVAIKFLKKGINVLIEKPISKTIDEAKNIIEKAKKYNCKLMVGHIERFNPCIIELKKRINDAGNIIKIEAKRVGPYPARIQDVGVTIDLSVHDIDIMNYLTESKPKKINSIIRQKINSKNEDLIYGTIEFENDVIGIIDTNWLTPKKIRKLSVLGEKGFFLADYLTQNLYFYENDFLEKDETKEYDYADIMRGVAVGKMIKYPIDKKEPLRLEMEHFIDCVKNDKEPIVSGNDGLKALETALSLLEKKE